MPLTDYFEDAGPEYDYLPEFQNVAHPPDSIMEKERARRRADLQAQIEEERARGESSESSARTIGQGMELVRPFAASAENPFGLFSSALKGAANIIAPVTESAGNVAVGLASDIGAGGISPRAFPQTSRALTGERVGNADANTALLPRIAEGAVRGAGEMAPALAAMQVGVPPSAAFGGQMGLTGYGRTGDPIEGLKQAAIGTLLGPAGEVGGPAGAMLTGRVAVTLPAMFERPTLAAGEVIGRQALQNALMTAGNLPELIKAYKEDPAKGIDMLAEQIGVNLAFEAGHLPGTVRETIAKDQAKAWLGSPEYRNHVDELTTRMTQPAPVQLPAAMRELAKQQTPGAPNALQERQAAKVYGNVQEQPGQRTGNVPAEGGLAEVPQRAVPPGDTGGAPSAEEAGGREVPLAEERFKPAEEKPLPERFTDKPISEAADLVKDATLEEVTSHPGGATGFMWDIGARAKTAEDVAALKRIAEESSAETKRLIEAGDINGAMRVASRQPAEAYEYATGVKLDGTPKWSTMEKFAADKGKTYRPPVPDEQYLKAKGETAAVPKATEASPFEHQKFTTTDAEGNAVADIPKLRAAVESGEVNGGVAANPLLAHLLKPSEAHPLKAVKLLDLSPQELAAITGRGVAYKGRFTLDRATPEGTIEILTRDANGNPLTHADVVQTLNHELTHNAVTSKIDQASPEIKADLQSAFDHAVASVKGTELEGHNAFTDAHEFLSEAASSPRIQTALAQIPKPGAKGPVTIKNSIWGQVLGVIKKVLGLPDKLGGKETISLLDETMRISSELEGIKREAKGTLEERFAKEEEGRKGLPMAPRAGESGAISLAPLQALVSRAAPPVREALNAVRETAKEAMTAGRMTDYRRSVLNWSSKLQRSFHEAATTQRDIETRVPDKVRREGITNWIQADGDAAVLQQRAAATTDPKLRAGYEAALRLTPEELAVANEVRQRYQQFAQRGQAADVINNFKENYVTQIWNLLRGPGGTGTGRTLKERFRFSKASTFPTFFDGEQAGYSPKTKDISRLLPVYMHEMNSVIAARELVQQMSRGRASDGRPLVTTRGSGTVVPGTATSATLIRPKAVRGQTNDYKTLANQPALQGWRWATKDAAGNPVFLKGDLALHPEAYNQLKNVLGRSAIREWYTTPTTRLAEIPKKLVQGIDLFNSETKRTMLGLLAPFHQVQTGTHAVGHRVNPFGNIPKIDLVNDPAQVDATKHGLMLAPDRASEGQFMEGFRTSGLVSKIPGLGRLSDLYSNYLFHQYIPGLKFKTYEAILRRNQGVYAEDLAARRMKPEDIKVLSAEQANAAYGHLNYADLARNPTIQHVMQLGLLAPDFLEARTRFAGQAAKGATGGKAGREQTLALATLALTQMAAAYVSAKLSGGEWDKRHPFEFHVGSRTFTMRSVPEDLSNLISNTRTFVHSRLSPIIGKGALQYLTGVDYAGRKVSAGETTKELLAQPIPITLRTLPGVREASGAARPGAINWWEQLAGAVGLKISRYYPNQEINRLYSDWLQNNKDPQVKADYERNQAAVFPVSKYKALDAALSDRNQPAAVKAIQDLKAQGQKSVDILERMRPVVGQGVNIRAKPLFHQSEKHEAAFRNSLNPEERKEYKKAIDQRAANWREFLKAWRQRGAGEAEKPKGLQSYFAD